MQDYFSYKETLFENKCLISFTNNNIDQQDQVTEHYFSFQFIFQYYRDT